MASPSTSADTDATFSVFLGMAGIAIATTLTLGVNAAYFICAVSAVTGGIVYHKHLEEWFNAYQPVWLGAAAGFFFGGSTFGPIGMILGAGLGLFTGRKVNGAIDVVSKTTESVKKVAAPIELASQATQHAWNGLKNGVTEAYQRFTSEPPPEMTIAKSPSLKKKRSVIIDKPIMVKKRSKAKRKTRQTLEKSQPPDRLTQLWQTFSGFFSRQTVPTPPQAVEIPPALTWQKEAPKVSKKPSQLDKTDPLLRQNGPRRARTVFTTSL